MTISILAKTSLPQGTRPTGTPLGSKMTGTINACFIGDSITVGLVTLSAPDAFRYPLHQLLTSTGLTMNWIGDQTTAGAQPVTNHHRGLIGSTLTNHMSGGSFDDVAYLTGLATKPDILSHYLGMNDSSDATLTANYGANLTTFIQQLDAIKSFRHMICLINARGDATLNANVAAVNAAIISTVATLQSAAHQIVLCDTRVLVGTQTRVSPHYERGSGSWIHPINDGYVFMAACMFPSFLNTTGRNAVWAGQSSG